MLKFTLTSNLKTYDLKWAIEKSLIQSTEVVRWKAVKNAPYQTWNLRRSITTEVKRDKWIIWTNVKYAKVREYINKKNPSRRFYMKRALEKSWFEIKRIFTKNINNALNKK